MTAAGQALILFDIDGTLLRAGDAHHGAAFTHAFEQVYGKPVTLEGVPLAGMLDAQIARILFERHELDRDEADARLHEMMAAMGSRYVEAIAEQSLRERLLPGVTEAIIACNAEGWITGALTGNGRLVGEAKIKGAGLDHLLSFGAYGDSAVERGHLIDEAIVAAENATGHRVAPSDTVLVGDTPNDISAARAGGAKVVAVATGRFDVDALSNHDPDAVLENMADTKAFIDSVKAMLA